MIIIQHAFPCRTQLHTHTCTWYKVDGGPPRQYERGLNWVLYYSRMVSAGPIEIGVRSSTCRFALHAREPESQKSLTAASHTGAEAEAEWTKNQTNFSSFISPRPPYKSPPWAGANRPQWPQRSSMLCPVPTRDKVLLVKTTTRTSTLLPQISLCGHAMVCASSAIGFSYRSRLRVRCTVH